jgi:hypothetical protein
MTATSFKLGDSVLIEYMENHRAKIYDDTVDTTNPYTEIWKVEYVELTTLPVVEKTKINYNIDTRFDRDPIDLVLWAAVILTAVWQLFVIIKTIRN